ADGGWGTAFCAGSALSGASFIYGWAGAGGVLEHGPKKTISEHAKKPPSSAASTPRLLPSTSRTRPRAIVTRFMRSVVPSVRRRRRVPPAWNHPARRRLTVTGSRRNAGALGELSLILAHATVSSGS